MSLGYGLAYSCLTGAISLLSPQTSQGGVLGVHQSLSSLSRILGPAIGGWMYRDLSHQAPFLVSALLALAGLMLAFLFRKIIPSKGKI